MLPYLIIRPSSVGPLSVGSYVTSPTIGFDMTKPLTNVANLTPKESSSSLQLYTPNLSMIKNTSLYCQWIKNWKKDTTNKKLDAPSNCDMTFEWYIISMYELKRVIGDVLFAPLYMWYLNSGVLEKLLA